MSKGRGATSSRGLGLEPRSGRRLPGQVSGVPGINSPKNVFNEHCSLSRSSVQVDLTSVAPEVTHELWKPIEGGQVKPR